MKHKIITVFSVVLCALLLVGCSSKKEESQSGNQSPSKLKTSRFNGNYNRAFNDMHELHITAAKKNGVTPLKTREEAEKRKDKLTFLPEELPFYKTDRLTHSVPYLVPSAAKLVADISVNFRDSLRSKGLPPYKLVLTSLTRTDEDIKKLTKRNINASHNSAHCYGTTFDISWKRFGRINNLTEEVDSEKLKYVLGQVLYDLKADERCYIKHEKKQACFHITVR